MELLIAGLVLFVGIHLLPSAAGLRASLVERLGEVPYKIVYSLISAAGLVLIVMGLMRAEYQHLYAPPAWTRHLTMLLMIPALYLFFSGKRYRAPSSVRAYTAHPMAWGVVVWSVAHLLSNGDLAHVLFFASIGGFAALSIVTGNLRGAQPEGERPPFKQEVLFIAVVAVLYALLLRFHQHYTGMPLISPG